MANKSEVARMLSQIDAEVEAAQQALYGLAQVGGHDEILARQAQLAEAWAGKLKGMFEAIHPEEKAR